MIKRRWFGPPGQTRLMYFDCSPGGGVFISILNWNWTVFYSAVSMDRSFTAKSVVNKGCPYNLYIGANNPTVMNRYPHFQNLAWIFR